MPKPITPLVGCEVFVQNEKDEILLIQRADNAKWAMPGGCQDLGETPMQCAVRECFEESGYKVEVTELLGVFSSQCYPYINYPWKENEFCHVLFAAKIVGGEPTVSKESLRVGWFREDRIPPLSDGHDIRLSFSLRKKRENLPPHFE